MLPLFLCLITQKASATQPSDSLASWYEITEAYPDSSIAAEAWQKIIEFYIRTGEIRKAETAIEEVKSKMTDNPGIYKKPYGYGLTSLFDYYLAAGDASTAKQYAKRLQSELGSTEAAELLYEAAQERPPLEEDIEKLRTRREEHSQVQVSEYFPGPDLLYALACMQFDDKEYYQSAEVLLYLKYLPESEEAEAVRPQAMLLLGRVYYGLERYDFAHEELTEWQKRYEESHPELAPEALYVWAESLEKWGYIGNALEVYQHIADVYPRSGFTYPSWRKVLWSLINGGKSEWARGVLEVDDRIHGDPVLEPQLQVCRGWGYRYLGDYEQAAKIFEYWLADYRDRDSASASLVPEVYFELGLSYQGLERFDDALDTLLVVFNRFPQSSWAGKAALRITDLYVRAKEIGDAVEFVEEVKGRYNSNEGVYRAAYVYGLLSLFEYYCSTGDVSSAKESEEKRFESGLRELWPEFLCRLVNETYESGWYEESQMICEKFKAVSECEDMKDELSPFLPRVCLLLSNTYYQLGQFENARAELEEWLEHYQESDSSGCTPEVYYYIGLVYYNLAGLGDSKDVRDEYFKKALEFMERIKRDFLRSAIYCKSYTTVNRVIEDCQQRLQSQD